MKRAPVAQWKSSGFLNLVRKFDSCRGHSRTLDQSRASALSRANEYSTR